MAYDLILWNGEIIDPERPGRARGHVRAADGCIAAVTTGKLNGTAG